MPSENQTAPIRPGVSSVTPTRGELGEAARLLREAGARGSDGYPPSQARVEAHEKAAKAVEDAARELRRVMAGG